MTTPQTPDGQHPEAPARPHVALRIDGYPPDIDPDRRLYLCQHGCEFLTGPQLRASAIPHHIPDQSALTLAHYTRHGADHDPH